MYYLFARGLSNTFVIVFPYLPQDFESSFLKYHLQYFHESMKRLFEQHTGLIDPDVLLQIFPHPRQS